MLTRAATFLVLSTMQLWAADSDFRAGLWEGTIERGRGVERITLLLTISVHGLDGPNPVTSALARFESDSGVCGSNQAGIEPYLVSFDCMPVDGGKPSGSAAGHFEGYFSPRSNLVSGTWRGEPIQLARPKQSDSLLEGDWVAEGTGQACVVRFFDGNRSGLLKDGGGVTIDMYSRAAGVFGKQVFSNTWRPASAIRDGLSLFWDDTERNSFRGKLSAEDSELTGVWQGHDFLCDTPDHKVTFRRTQSAL